MTLKGLCIFFRTKNQKSSHRAINFLLAMAALRKNAGMFAATELKIQASARKYQLPLNKHTDSTSSTCTNAVETDVDKDFNLIMGANWLMPTTSPQF